MPIRTRYIMYFHPSNIRVPKGYLLGSKIEHQSVPRVREKENGPGACMPTDGSMPILAITTDGKIIYVNRNTN